MQEPEGSLVKPSMIKGQVYLKIPRDLPLPFSISRCKTIFQPCYPIKLGLFDTQRKAINVLKVFVDSCAKETKLLPCLEPKIGLGHRL